MSTERTLPCSRKKLIETAKNTLTVILNFLVNLTPKGINQQYYDTFRDEIAAVAALKTERALENEAAATNATVKAMCLKNHKWGMLLKTYMKRQYGNKGIQLDEFPNNFDDLRADEAGMIDTLPQVISLAKKYKRVLLTKGMDADFIEKGEALLAELDTHNSDAKKMEADHKAYREERHLAQLALYDKINYINSIGREVFASDPVNIKYFDSPWGAGKKSDNKDDDKDKPAAGEEK
jgi:hypothetical protein